MVSLSYQKALGENMEKIKNKIPLNNAFAKIILMDKKPNFTGTMPAFHIIIML
jgi:hypothetical protein